MLGAVVMYGAQASAMFDDLTHILVRAGDNMVQLRDVMERARR